MVLPQAIGNARRAFRKAWEGPSNEERSRRYAELSRMYAMLADLDTLKVYNVVLREPGASPYRIAELLNMPIDDINPRLRQLEEIGLVERYKPDNELLRRFSPTQYMRTGKGLPPTSSRF